ncbi:MAG: hypothetical protein V3T31_00720 [candidate division Zixibacteria bacterium]
MSESAKKKDISQGYWLIYIALTLAGVLFVSEALTFEPLQRVPARLGIALLYSAFALMFGKGRTSGIVSAILIWVAAITVFFV